MEVLAVITIGLVLGLALHWFANGPGLDSQPKVLFARGQSTPSSSTLETSLHVKPSIATERPTLAKPKTPLVLPPQPTDQAVHHSNEPVPNSLTIQAPNDEQPERPPTTRSPLAIPPSIPSTITPITTSLPVEDIPALPEEKPSHEQGGDLNISGIVLTDAGDPVAELEVTATVNRFFGADAQVTQNVQAYHAHTDDDGFYEFFDLVDGEYILQTVPMPPYQSTSQRVRAGLEDVTLVVAEARSHQVQGLVIQAANDAPLSGVTVAAAGHTTVTDDDGHYTLVVQVLNRGPSPIVLRFTHPKYRVQQAIVPWSSQETDMPLTLKDVAMEAIEGRAVVSGVVESQIGGKPLAGLRVFLSPAKGLGQQDTLTKPDGTFQFLSVPWGTYTLVVVPKTGYQDLTHPNLQVAEAGVEDLHLRLTSLPTATLAGQFVDPTGQPVRGLTMFLNSRTVRTFTRKSVTSDPSGYFSMVDVPVGEAEFTTGSSPYLTITGFTIRPGITDPVILPVDWGGQTLTGQVVTAGGVSLPGTEVTLTWSHTKNGVTSRSIRHNTADATGTFRFTQLGPGRHTLNVSARGYVRTLLHHEVGPTNSTVEVRLTEPSS